MGLDTVELVMEVEESFGITIPDADAEKLQTVGQLYHDVLSKMDGPTLVTSGCLSAAAFYRLRRRLMGRFRVERRRIRPATALDDLIPKRGRRAEWQQLGEDLGWRLPSLHRPDWVWLMWLAAVIGLAAMEIVAWGRLAGFAPGATGLLLFLFLAGSALLGVLVHRLTSPLATGFPTADIRGLIPVVLVANLETFRINNPHGWTSREVWEMLVTIIAEQVGVARETLTESTSFVNDLGMG